LLFRLHLVAGAAAAVFPGSGQRLVTLPHRFDPTLPRPGRDLLPRTLLAGVAPEPAAGLAARREAGRCGHECLRLPPRFYGEPARQPGYHDGSGSPSRPMRHPAMAKKPGQLLPIARWWLRGPGGHTILHTLLGLLVCPGVVWVLKRLTGF